MFKEMLVIFLACLLISAVIAPQQQPAANTSSTGAATGGSAANNSTTTESMAPVDEAILSAAKELGGDLPAASAQETSDDTFDDDVLKSNIPVLVDFSIQGCEPCRRMAPILDSLAGEYEGRLKIVKLDADLNSKIKERYNVNAFPTFILFNDGKQAARSTGAMPKAELVSILDRHALKADSGEENGTLD